MIQDITVSRYATYAELEEYMYGSAAVVGIMMSYVIGFKDEGTLERAKALGEAMQLTNFLRDIQEDYRDRGRIYVPLEDLARFGVSEDDFREQKMSPEFIELMRFEIDRARKLYAYAEPGIAELAPSGRFAIRLASRVYAAILIKIEQAGYNVFLGRVKTTKFEKLTLLYAVWKQTRSTR
jgi:phytoene synthase